MSEIKTINGRKYAFNEKGAMLSGLWYLEVNSSNKISTASNATEEIDSEAKLNNYTKLTQSAASFVRPTSANPKNGLYYFGDESDGSMKTGIANVSIDGDSYSFKFRNSGDKGVGVDGLDGSTYYVNGKKVKADSDDKYKVFVVDAIRNFKLIIKGECINYEKANKDRCYRISSSITCDRCINDLFCS